MGWYRGPWSYSFVRHLSCRLPFLDSIRFYNRNRKVSVTISFCDIDFCDVIHIKRRLISKEKIANANVHCDWALPSAPLGSVQGEGQKWGSHSYPSYWEPKVLQLGHDLLINCNETVHVSWHWSVCFTIFGAELSGANCIFHKLVRKMKARPRQSLRTLLLYVWHYSQRYKTKVLFILLSLLWHHK